MESKSSDSNISLYEETLKFYFVTIDDGPTGEIAFAREVSANASDNT